MTSLPDLPKICVSIGHGEPIAAQEHALANSGQAESFVELRIDQLTVPTLGSRITANVRREHPGSPILATCRRSGNGGHFRGSISEQIDLLQAAVNSGADLVDIEIETIEEFPAALEPFRGKALTIASYHNFQETPDLPPILRKMVATRADILKVATAIRRPDDNLKLLELCWQRPNMVVAGMGEAGTPTRLLAPKYGALFTYAAPDQHPLADREPVLSEVLPTAPGQIPATSMRDLYRVASANSETKIFAVIGDPVAQSKSPRIHNLAFQAAGFDGMYLPLLVKPDQLGNFIRLMRELPLSGASVTIPHKESVLERVDDIGPFTEAIGAVNTLYWKDGRLTGTNTDAHGIAIPLGRRAEFDDAKALVVGTGGAAKAAIAALQWLGANVWVSGRDRRKASRVASQLEALSMPFSRVADQNFDVMIHATPVGMWPDVEGNLFPDRVPAEIVFDLVYNPVETALLKRAADQGKTVISGIEMFIEQAAKQFHLWTGTDAPHDVMRNAVLERTVREAGQHG